MLDAIHDAQLREHGGAPGVRDDGLVDSALARPQHKFAYAARVDLGTLAAAYVFGLAKNHGFLDGNNRVAFMAAYTFLGLNGCDLEATELDVATVIDRVAAGRVSEPALAKWFRERVQPIGRR